MRKIKTVHAEALALVVTIAAWAIPGAVCVPLLIVGQSVLLVAHAVHHGAV